MAVTVSAWRLAMWTALFAWTTRPVTLGGVDLPEGAKLFLWLAAAGRDPRVFPEPDGFDLDRAGADRHLAFGVGLHYCLGASLGKLEARLALEELTGRFPRLRLVEGQQLSFHPTSPSAARSRSGSAAAEARVRDHWWWRPAGHRGGGSTRGT